MDRASLRRKPRWYQEQILRHPHHRKVLRCGRRIGKCIEENQRIINPNTGEYQSVGELYNAQVNGSATPLLTLNESYQLENSEAFFIEDNGVKDTFAVVTKHGARVVLTGNHPVLTVDGWKEVDALRIGESIATPKFLPVYGTKQVDKNKLRILAYMLAAGVLTRIVLASRRAMKALERRYRRLVRHLVLEHIVSVIRRLQSI